MQSTPPDDLDRLLARGLDVLDESGADELEAFLAEHPASAAELRRRIELLAGIGLLEDSEPPSPPESIGPYRLGACLGGGGMGLVHEAVEVPLGRRVALKTIRPDLLGFQDARARFQRELEAVAKLSHPGIVPVYGAGEDAGRPWFAMECIRGATLGQLLDRLAERDPARLTGADLRDALALASGQDPDDDCPLFSGPWSEVVASIGRDVAAALDHAHRAGVLHRDVKPSNVLLGLDGRPRLIDFGLARADAVETLTRTGALVGSLPYMAPEQTRGEDLDRRTDVYGLGATLIELATLEPPFTERGVPALQRAIVEGRSPDLRGRNRRLPRDLITVLEKAIEREPSRRYLSAAELARDLERVLTLLPVEARPISSLRRIRSWVRRKPGQAVAAGALVLAVLGGQLVVTQANARISKALDEALVERDRADRSSALARDALVEVLAELGREDLALVPGFAPRRAALLERSVDLWTELDELVPLVRGELVRAELQRERASVLSLLGRKDEAAVLLDQATETLERLARANPDSAEMAMQLADAWVDSTVELARTGNPAAARDRAVQAIEVLRPWTEEGVEAGVRAQALAMHRQAAHNASVNARVLGEPGEGWQAQSMASAQAWLELEPDNPDARFGLANSLTNAAQHAPDLEAALERWTRAEQILDVLSAEHSDPSYRYRLGVTRALIADALLESDLAESARWSRAAIEVFEPLSAEHRYSTDYRWRLTEAHDTLGIAELRSGDRESAQTRFARSVEVLSEMVELNPTDLNLAESAGISYHNLAALQLDLGHTERALANATQALQRLEALALDWPRKDGPDLATNAAVLHARATAVAGQPIDPAALFGRVDSTAASNLVAWWSLAWACAEAIDEDPDCATWAVKALGRSLDAGLADRSELEHERFAALRERADFQALLERLE